MAYLQFARAFVGPKLIRRSPPFLQESRSFSSLARVSFSHEAMILHIIRLQYIVFLILSERSTYFIHVASPSLVSSNIGVIHCSTIGSPGVTVSTSFHSVGHDEPVVSPDWLQDNLRKPDVKRSTYFIHVASPSLVSSNIGVLHCSTIGSPGVTVSTSFHSVAHDEPVVSPDWLQDNLRKPDVKVLDASWYMPDEKRNPFQEYQVAHIPGALFFDVDGISDRKSNLPHMLPSEEAFAAAVSALDIHNKDGVVVYDGKGIFSAARVWWMFRVFGHDKVWVLDGGLPHWRASGFDVESSASGDAILKSNAAVEAVEKVYQQQQPVVRENIDGQTHQHIDARSKARFDGVAPEPRKGIRAGHVPGSTCIPFGQLLDASQKLLPKEELLKKFEQEGISQDRPVVTSCGTGVTACILSLGLHRLGKTDVPVYDGSWTEWGSHPDTPVRTS